MIGKWYGSAILRSMGLLAAIVLALAASTGLAEPNERSLENVLAVQSRNSARLMAVKGVVGTAVGLDAQGRPTVKVLTARGGVAGIPADLEGVPVEVQVTGVFIAIPGPPAGKKPPPVPGVDPTSRFDSPIPIGVSVGNEFHCSAGTIGCQVIDFDLVGTVYALSNVHVFDPWHYGDPLQNAVILGEKIVQPSRLDDPADNCSGAATSENMIGKVVACAPLDFGGGENLVDAAIAVVPTDGLADTRELDNGTPADGYGRPISGLGVAAELNQPVQKYGRSTGLTTGQVNGLNATITVGYVDGTATFVNQILISGRKFLKPGDSGSLVVTDPGREAVGLLFAGNTPGSLGVANPIGFVLEAFYDDGFDLTITGE